MVLPGLAWMGLYVSSLLSAGRFTYAVSLTITSLLLNQAMAAWTASFTSAVWGWDIRKATTPPDSLPLLEGSS